MKSTKQMQAELATLKAKKAKTPGKETDVSDDETSWLEASAHTIGAAPSAVIGFFSSVKTGYQYAEAKRNGKL